jgi:hypothetical protein
MTGYFRRVKGDLRAGIRIAADFIIQFTRMPLAMMYSFSFLRCRLSAEDV